MLYFHSVLETPADGDFSAVTMRTILYSIANIMLPPHLFKRFTWTGMSPLGPRLRFDTMDNIFRLVHAIMLKYDPAYKLENVKKFYKESICRPGPSRSQNTSARKSSAHNVHKTFKRRTKAEIEAAMATNDIATEAEHSCTQPEILPAIQENPSSQPQENCLNEMELHPSTQEMCTNEMELQLPATAIQPTSAAQNDDNGSTDDEGNLVIDDAQCSDDEVLEELSINIEKPRRLLPRRKSKPRVNQGITAFLKRRKFFK